MPNGIQDLGFSFFHTLDEKAVNGAQLHSHREHFEVFVFLQGNAEFWVEGTMYPVHPNDILLMQHSEMHYINHLSDAAYERLVINIRDSFFTMHGCEAYKAAFLNRPLGLYNCIPAETAVKHRIPPLLKRLELYLADPDDQGVAASAVLLEFLYLINRIGVKTDQGTYFSEQVKEILLYINNHLAEPLSLDILADKFYITKYHLCRSFKRHTGYTVNEYITYKRLVLARELHGRGMSWTEASEDAGFGNYSNFYKLFRRMYGHAPTNRSHGKTDGAAF